MAKGTTSVKKPASIKIGSRVYKIEWVDTPLLQDGEPCLGITQLTAGIIKMALVGPDGDAVAEDQIVSTLLHEAQHVFLDIYRPTWEKQEQHCDWFAECVCCLMKDNPWLKDLF